MFIYISLIRRKWREKRNIFWRHKKNCIIFFQYYFVFQSSSLTPLLSLFQSQYHLFITPSQGRMRSIAQIAEGMMIKGEQRAGWLSHKVVFGVALAIRLVLVAFAEWQDANSMSNPFSILQNTPQLLPNFSYSPHTFPSFNIPLNIAPLQCLSLPLLSLVF